MEPRELPNLKEWAHSHEGRSHSVFSIQSEGDGAILLMHELPGLSDSCLDLGNRLNTEGFAVHMPLLFGSFRQDSVMRGTAQMWCLRREFELFRNRRSSPIADWIRSLCDRLASDGKPVAVVGMCATGGLVLSVLYAPSVKAGVVAQPSLPFRLFYTGRSKGNLGASIRDVDLSVGSQTALLSIRFATDWRCPANRSRAISDAFDDSALTTHTAPGRDHSTLTYDSERSDGAVERAIEFLKENLAT